MIRFIGVMTGITLLATSTVAAAPVNSCNTSLNGTLSCSKAKSFKVAARTERKNRRLKSWWQKLAVERVGRRIDRDIIRLGPNKGRYYALRLKARRNDIRIHRVRIHYGNGNAHNLKVDRRLNAGESSDILKLRGRRGRFINSVTLVYDTAGRGPRAKIELWGQKMRVVARRPEYGPRWRKTSTQHVNRRRDQDTVRLGFNEGRFDALRLRALRNDVRVHRVRVRYGNGRTHNLRVDKRLNAGESSDVLKLRGHRGRAIRNVTLVYDTIGRGPRARMQIWGREKDRYASSDDRGSLNPAEALTRIIGGILIDKAFREERKSDFQRCDEKYNSFRWSDGTYNPGRNSSRKLCPFLKS